MDDQNKGGLHRSTGTPMHQPVSAEKMKKAMAGHYGPKAKKQAEMARMRGRMP